MRLLKAQRDALREFWHSGFSYEVMRSSAAFLILIFLGFGSCMASPKLLDNIMTVVFSFFNGLDLQSSGGQLSAAGLFLNNLRACTVAILCGLIPFLYLSALALGVNAMLLGVLAAWYVRGGHSFLIYLAALLPHGIFEIPAIVLSFSAGLYFCGRISRELRNGGSYPLSSCLRQAARIWVLIVPLLAAAALMEAYVTPLVLNLF